MNEVNVVYAADKNSVNLAIVSACSLIRNAGNDDNINIYILYNQLTEQQKNSFNYLKKYKENVHIFFIFIDETVFNNMPLTDWITKTAYFRYQAADLISDKDKILYLDCDTLVLKSLSELFKTDITNKYLACVTEVDGQEKRITFELNNTPYFNSGMMLINAKKWREDKIFNQLCSLAKNSFDKFKFGDQDVINSLIKDNKVMIHPKFNYIESQFIYDKMQLCGNDLEEWKQAGSAPVICHLVGMKPPNFTANQKYISKWWENAKFTDCYKELLKIYNKTRNKYYLKQIFSISNSEKNKKTKIITLLGVKIELPNRTLKGRDK